MANVNVFGTYQQTNVPQQNGLNAPDVSDYVTNVSPKDSPLFSMISSNAGTSRVKENVTDDFVPANGNNALVEGATLTSEAISQRDTVRNTMQIFSKTINISRTQEEVAKYGGIKSEIAYQTKKKYTELATDVEKAFVQNAGAAGDASTPRQLTGLINKISGHAQSVAGVSGNTEAIDDDNIENGTTTANLEAYEDKLNDMFDRAWETGQTVDTVFVGGKHKRRISKLTSKVTRNTDAEAKTQILSINTYDSDFGTVNIILDRYVPDTHIVGVALDLWEVSYLSRFNQYKLAKISDGTQISVIGELTLDGKTDEAGALIKFI